MNAIALPAIQVVIHGLQQIVYAIDFQKIAESVDADILETAWNQLPVEQQNRITEIVNSNSTPDPQEMATLIANCSTPEQLATLKEDFGEILVKAAWRLIPKERRAELKLLCPPKEQPQPSSKPKTLLDLSTELERLEELLESLLEDDETATAVIDQLLAQKSETEEAYLRKIDNYAALIQSRRHWADARSAEAERLERLADGDRHIAETLAERLRLHLEAQGKKKVKTQRFNLTVANNGGLQPIGFNVPNLKDLPARFQKIHVDADKTALREALEAGDPEATAVAYLRAPISGSLRDRGTHLRIR